ncbi:MAG: M6 family extracellular metalloprotease [Bacteroidetes bacterium HLUCCA01]|nr:MAG: M6 family extracellular metalloprotease [Bacteroidetes bacterium HLUCCA01]
MLLATWPVFAGQPQHDQASVTASGNIHIVAVMVEFQRDDNRFTSGDGTFNPDFLDRDDITIDPLPHDRGYFEAHLLFAKNYFERVSNDQLSVSYEVLPEIVTLQQEMAAYSPLGEDGKENEKLAFLARDVWQEADRQGMLSGRTLDPDRTMYVIFHAGVGRDLELVGTTLTKTPQDIPSVFLSRTSLSRLLETPDFGGFNVNGNIVHNSAILPETQSRPGESVIGESFVLELSINGILTATVGSFLGLPDLFNTDTGESGIGRFGLMDGAGFFSYFGLFPPEPSAWEKTHLGWVTPFDISDAVAASGQVTVTAPGNGTQGTIAKLPISSDEYFLIENRIRDPRGTGLELTIRRPDGVLETVNIPRDETRFSNSDLSEIRDFIPPGVLVDVSHFDWSLPGQLDAGDDRETGTDDDRFLNGGILIWHIDDQIIRERIQDNAINNNPDQKGVRLVEADAAQDIGRPAGGLTQYAQGAAFDFWWAGNDFTVITQNGERIVLYENRFGDDTRPNNRSNSGARTYFEFLNFSDYQVNATFDVRADRGSVRLQPAELPQPGASPSGAFTLEDTGGPPLAVSRFVSQTDTLLVLPAENGFTLMHTGTGNEQFFNLPSPLLQPLIWSDGITLGGRGEVVHVQWDIPSSQFTQLWNQSIPDGASALIRNPSDSQTIEVAGTPLVLNKTDGSIAETRVVNRYQSGSADGVTRHGALTDGRIQSENESDIFTLSGPESASQRLYLAVTKSGETGTPVFLVITSERFLFLDGQSGDILADMAAADYGWPLLHDLDGDHRADIVYVNHSQGTLEARNQLGAMLDGFPLRPEQAESGHFIGTPLIAQHPSSDETLLLIPGTNSYSYSLHVYQTDRLNQPVETLLIGSTGNDRTLLQPVLLDGVLYSVAPGGELRSWRLEESYSNATSYPFGSPTHNMAGIVLAVDQNQPSGGLLVAEETYNWPNPATDHTHLRFMTTAAAEVSLSVITYAGQPVYETRQQTPGMMPTDVRINTRNWANGVYFARITARGDGKTEHMTITMVVAR